MIRIPVYRGGQIVGDALVDDEHAGLSAVRWWFAGNYAVCSSRGPLSAAMHRQVCGLLRGDPRVIHHINEDTLDNRRSNLEICASKSEANSRPHPKARAATKAGIDRYRASLRAA